MLIFRLKKLSEILLKGLINDKYAYFMIVKRVGGVIKKPNHLYTW